MGAQEPPTLTKEIAAYESMRNALETDHFGKWVIVHGGELVALHDTFEAAAEEAMGRFGAGPYLIRQVGAGPITLPASVLYNPVAVDASG